MFMYIHVHVHHNIPVIYLCVLVCMYMYMYTCTMYTCIIMPCIVSVCLVQYDNVLMEESAQILEVETFIPLMLQVSICNCAQHMPFLYTHTLYIHACVY